MYTCSPSCTYAYSPCRSATGRPRHRPCTPPRPPGLARQPPRRPDRPRGAPPRGPGIRPRRLVVRGEPAPHLRPGHAFRGRRRVLHESVLLRLRGLRAQLLRTPRRPPLPHRAPPTSRAARPRRRTGDHPGPALRLLRPLPRLRPDLLPALLHRRLPRPRRQAHRLDRAVVARPAVRPPVVHPELARLQRPVRGVPPSRPTATKSPDCYQVAESPPPPVNLRATAPCCSSWRPWPSPPSPYA